MRGLILDFDGTILDTETPEVDIWRDLFREHGREFPDSWWQNAIGRGADQIEEWPAEILAREIEGRISAEALEAERKRRFHAHLEASPPREGIRPLLEHCRGQAIPVGIASSSKQVWVRGHLERMGLDGYFHAILCADDVARAKPFPDLYHAAVDRLGLKDALAIEDSPNGIRAARDAGLTVYAFANPLTRALDLSHAHGHIDRADHPNVLSWLQATSERTS